MTAMIGTATLPAQVCSRRAWEAFEHLFTQTNFRLQIAALDPIGLTIEHDAAFGLCLAGTDAWEPGEKAKGWIANRVVELAAQVDKTSLRRLGLQVPRPGDEPAIEAFLTGLQRRLKDDLRIEIVLDPAWTSERISESGRQKLKEIGLAPPEPRTSLPK